MGGPATGPTTRTPTPRPATTRRIERAKVWSKRLGKAWGWRGVGRASRSDSMPCFYPELLVVRAGTGPSCERA